MSSDSISKNHDLALPVGSLVLVTGASGYIASNIIVELLDLGYRVRGTARSEEKAAKTKEVFKNVHYETAIVPDMLHDDSFDEVVKDVEAIIHTASVLTWSPNPQEVIPPSVQGAVNILKSAVKESKVKRFVFTSSSVAVTTPKRNVKSTITKDMWNDEVEKFANIQPPYTADMATGVYSVSKLRAEREVWKFVKEQKPSFVVNCVLPNFNMGRVVDSPGVTAGMVQNAFKGNVAWDFPPQWMVNVVDDARLHIAAAIDQTLVNDRIFAFDSPFNWGDVLAIFRELRPDMTFPEPKSDEGRDLSEVDNGQGAQLLRKWWGQDGYAGLKESIKQTVQNM